MEKFSSAWVSVPRNLVNEDDSRRRNREILFRREKSCQWRGGISGDTGTQESSSAGRNFAIVIRGGGAIPALFGFSAGPAQPGRPEIRFLHKRSPHAGFTLPRNVPRKVPMFFCIICISTEPRDTPPSPPSSLKLGLVYSVCIPS